MLIIALRNHRLLPLVAKLPSAVSIIAVPIIALPISVKDERKTVRFRSIMGPGKSIMERFLTRFALLWRTECGYDSPSGRKHLRKTPVHNKANFRIKQN